MSKGHNIACFLSTNNAADLLALYGLIRVASHRWKISPLHAICGLKRPVWQTEWSFWTKGSETRERQFILPLLFLADYEGAAMPIGILRTMMQSAAVAPVALSMCFSEKIHEELLIRLGASDLSDWLRKRSDEAWRAPQTPHLHFSELKDLERFPWRNMLWIAERLPALAFIDAAQRLVCPSSNMEELAAVIVLVTAMMTMEIYDFDAISAKACRAFSRLSPILEWSRSVLLRKAAVLRPAQSFHTRFVDAETIWAEMRYVLSASGFNIPFDRRMKSTWALFALSVSIISTHILSIKQATYALLKGGRAAVDTALRIWSLCDLDILRGICETLLAMRDEHRWRDAHSMINAAAHLSFVRRMEVVVPILRSLRSQVLNFVAEKLDGFRTHDALEIEHFVDSIDNIAVTLPTADQLMKQCVDVDIRTMIEEENAGGCLGAYHPRSLGV